MKNHRAVIAAVLLFVLVPAASYACPVCFGAPGSPQTKGMNNAIWFLLGTIGLVQAGFVALFVTFWKRARAAQRRRESFRLLDGGAA